MKFQYSLALLVASASAISTGGQVVLDALTAVADATTGLGSAVDAYTGGPITDLQNALGPVLSAINNGNTAVAATSELEISDAASILAPLQALTASVTSSIDATVAKKDLFDEAGFGYTILLSLKSILDATNTFITTVNSKLGPLSSAGPPLEKPITDALSSGVAAFADETAPAGGSSATASATGPFPTVTLPTGSVTRSGAMMSRSRSRPLGSASGSRALSSKTAPPYVTPTTGPAGPTATGYHPSTTSAFLGAAVPTAAAAYGAVFLAGAAAVLAM